MKPNVRREMTTQKTLWDLPKYCCASSATTNVGAPEPVRFKSGYRLIISSLASSICSWLKCVMLKPHLWPNQSGVLGKDAHCFCSLNANMPHVLWIPGSCGQWDLF